MGVMWCERHWQPALNKMDNSLVMGGWGRGMWMVEEGIAGIHANGKNTVTKIKLKCVPSLSQWVADSWAMIVDF